MQHATWGEEKIKHDIEAKEVGGENQGCNKGGRGGGKDVPCGPQRSGPSNSTFLCSFVMHQRINHMCCCGFFRSRLPATNVAIKK